jgi:hypothetical protein
MKLDGLIRSDRRWDLHVYANGNTTFIYHRDHSLLGTVATDLQSVLLPLKAASTASSRAPVLAWPIAF